MLLVACPSGDDSEVAQADADDFADRLADDIADAASAAVDVVSAADDLQERDTATECYPTVGTCSFCTDVDGTPLSGSFTLGMEELPCGEAWDVGGRSLNYSVTALSIDGTWQASGIGGDYTVTASGTRGALLSTSSPRGGSHEFDASHTLDLEAEVIDLRVEGLTLTMDYAAFTGRAWTVDATLSDDTLSGSASSDDGVTCSISAGVEAPSVSCTAP